MSSCDYRTVFVERCKDYEPESISQVMETFDHLFAQSIKPGETVVLKPNWIAPCHKYNPGEWQSVITHPNLITGVLKKVVHYLGNAGKVVIADAPQNDSSFERIVELMPYDEWKRFGKSNGIDIEILDLRDHEWEEQGDVIINRKKLAGDPEGSVQFNLRDCSEFCSHTPSPKGYYGADYDIEETTKAHADGNHFYRISKTVVSADVFINLPKLKTHKKAGITCSLKNLVGVNTYKNYLPHYTEGTSSMGGDQFPDNDLRNRMEVYLLAYFKRILLRYENYAKYLVGVKRVGKICFGETRHKIRGGNWYGNDTLWRTILDLNKLLLYGKSDGTFGQGNSSHSKKYLAIVDGIISGEGNGPEAPDRLDTKIVIAGTNPVSVDCVAAKLMGFDYLKIPTLANAFKVKHFSFVNFSHDDIEVLSKTLNHFNGVISAIDDNESFNFRPAAGWIRHIELK